MGRIAAPFGVQGWVRVRPATAAVRSLLDYPQWWIDCEGDWQPRAVAEAKVQGHAVIARLEGCGDRESAAALRGRLVAVPRAALPRARENEYYWADLIGLKVVNAQAEDFGQVTDILQTGANDVLLVQGGRERLIPFIAQVIREVDQDTGVIRVDWGSDY